MGVAKTRESIFRAQKKILHMGDVINYSNQLIYPNICTSIIIYICDKSMLHLIYTLCAMGKSR